MQKEQFRKPRDALLTLCAMFIETAGARLRELGKMVTNIEHVRVPELTDHKCYVVRSVSAIPKLDEGFAETQRNCDVVAEDRTLRLEHTQLHRIAKVSTSGKPVNF